MQAAGKNVAGADVVMGGHDEMRQFGLGLAVPRERRIFAGNTVRSERAEEIELRRAGVFGPMIGQINDFTLRRPVDRAVGFVDKAAKVLGMPVIATGLPLLAIHALLHGPFALIGDEEAV